MHTHSILFKPFPLKNFDFNYYESAEIVIVFHDNPLILIIQTPQANKLLD